MGHFERIYQAAIEQQNKESEKYLDKIISEGISIDQKRLEDDIMITPAGKLAAEGNHNAAAFLQRKGAAMQFIAVGVGREANFYNINSFINQNANLIYSVAIGLGINGDLEKIYQFSKEHPDSVGRVAGGLALNGDHDKINRFINRFSAQKDMLVLNIALFLARKKDHSKINHFMNQFMNQPNQVEMLNLVACSLDSTEYLNNQESALRVFTSITDVSFRKELAEEVQNLKDRRTETDSLQGIRSSQYDIQKTLEITGKISYLIKHAQLNYAQARAWVKPEAQQILLRSDRMQLGVGLNMPEDNVFHMLAGLTGLELGELQSLKEKMLQFGKTQYDIIVKQNKSSQGEIEIVEVSEADEKEESTIPESQSSVVVLDSQETGSDIADESLNADIAEANAHAREMGISPQRLNSRISIFGQSISRQESTDVHLQGQPDSEIRGDANPSQSHVQPSP